MLNRFDSSTSLIFKIPYELLDLFGYVRERVNLKIKCLPQYLGDTRSRPHIDLHTAVYIIYDWFKMCEMSGGKVLGLKNPH